MKKIVILIHMAHMRQHARAPIMFPKSSNHQKKVNIFFRFSCCLLDMVHALSLSLLIFLSSSRIYRHVIKIGYLKGNEEKNIKKFSEYSSYSYFLSLLNIILSHALFSMYSSSNPGRQMVSRQIRIYAKPTWQTVVGA